MKFIFKLLSLLIIVSIVICPLVNYSVFAKTSSTIAFNKSQLTIGDELTVTVNINADKDMYACVFRLNYDPNILEFISGESVEAGSAAGVLPVTLTAAEVKTRTAKYTFKAIGVGSARITTSDAFFVDYDDNGVEIPSQGGTVSVKAKPTTSSTTSTSSTSSTTSNNSSQALSSDATLKSLAISDGTLSPKFSASKTSYSVVVPNSVTEIKLYATAKAEGAKVDIKGDIKSLKIGKNQITVAVTAPDGTVKNYTVNVTRSESEEVPSEPVSNEEPTTSENPLNPVIDGVKYSIATDLSGVALLNGFTATTTQFSGQQVAVATDADNTFKIYYLKAEDSTDLVPYTYDENKEVFEKLVYLVQRDTVYIVCNLPDGYTTPEDYYGTSGVIAGLEIKCYAHTDATMNDFYYIYCFANGRYGFYRYDSRENVLQRYPELKLTATDNGQDADVDIDSNSTFLGRFNSLTTNAKIIVIGLVFVILFGIALAVLLVLKYVRKKDFEALSESDEFNNFGKATVISNFSVIDDYDDLDEDEDFDEEDEEDEDDDTEEDIEE